MLYVLVALALPHGYGHRRHRERFRHNEEGVAEQQIDALTLKLEKLEDKVDELIGNAERRERFWIKFEKIGYPNDPYTLEDDTDKTWAKVKADLKKKFGFSGKFLVYKMVDGVMSPDAVASSDIDTKQQSIKDAKFNGDMPFAEGGWFRVTGSAY